ncbi:hypothetical protein [Anatilimnocola floriformis]|uniref:hypothetical protein n=1 Tax=Anatilimnocola floriformis TaxID=2948575 RepID=UPI0020C481C7|nr:hypothetical protein [Anatilimnocola floriformis]
MSNAKSVFDLTRDERQELAVAMMQRGVERLALAKKNFEQLYPAAPPEMIKAAVFHVYVDGTDAAVLWLAEMERFLRDPSRTLHSGVTWDLIGHLYSWHMLEALMPAGKPGLLSMLDEISEFAKTGDYEAIPGAIEQIKEMLNGDEDPPVI